MDIAESAFGIGIKGTGVGLRSGNIGIDGRHKSGFPELPQHNAAKFRHIQGR